MNQKKDEHQERHGTVHEEKERGRQNSMKEMKKTTNGVNIKTKRSNKRRYYT